MLAHPVVERRAVDAERARGMRDVALRGVDRRDDRGALLLVQALGERATAVAGRGRRGRGGRGGRAAGELEIGGAELGATGQDERALDHVLELADVAGPGVAAERRRRARVETAHGLAGGGRVLAD